MCRRYGEAEESGAHMALVCIENEGLGRWFDSWDQIDDPARWRCKVQKKDRVEIVDLAESFLLNSGASRGLEVLHAKQQYPHPAREWDQVATLNYNSKAGG